MRKKIAISLICVRDLVRLGVVMLLPIVAAFTWSLGFNTCVRRQESPLSGRQRQRGLGRASPIHVMTIATKGKERRIG